MKLFSIAAAAAVLTMTAPAVAAGVAHNDVKAEKKQDAQQKVCRTLRTTGSRMGERVCLTRDQWQKIDEDK